MKYIIIALLAIISSCKTLDIIMAGHSCKWGKCPYKGSIHFRRAVILYTGEDDGPGYWLDLYHLQYPTLEYEELEEMYFQRQLTHYI